jgi:hypothetical protein
VQGGARIQTDRLKAFGLQLWSLDIFERSDLGETVF